MAIYLQIYKTDAKTDADGDADADIGAMKIMANTQHSPVERDGDQGEDRCGNRYVGHKIVDGAINRAKWPIRVHHEYKVEDTIQ